MTEAPITAAGRALFTDMDPGDMLESNGVTWDDVCAIEAEAIAAERARIAAAVEGLWRERGGGYVSHEARAAVLAIVKEPL